MTDTSSSVSSPAPIANTPPPVADDGGMAKPPSRHVALKDLSLEHKHWTNPRSVTGLDDASIQSLADSIKRNTLTTDDVVYAGIRSPLEVVMVKGPSGSVINLVIEGQRRMRAAALVTNEDAMIPVIDLEPEPVDFTPAMASQHLLVALDMVGTRAGLSSYELSESAERLRNSRDPETGKDYTLARIAAVIHRSESWVSKILSARANATPKLLHMWKRGDITDEQFKDMAAQKDPEKQKEVAAKVVDARKSGDKAEARTLAKEQKAEARAKEPAPSKPTAAPKAEPASAHKPPVVRGPQAEIPAVVAPATPKLKPMMPAVIEDILATAAKRPPTHDYVKGVLAGIKLVTGRIDMTELSNAWPAYIAHVSGAPTATKAKAKAKASPAPKKAKAKAKRK